LTANLGEVFAIFSSAFTGLLPITAIQLLWVNFITDIFPAAALGTDPPAPNIMKQKPRGRDERIIDKRWALLVGAIATKKAIVTLALFFAIYWSTGSLIQAQSISFTWVVLSHFVRISAVRAEEGIPFFSNKWVTISLVFSAVLQLAILYTPMAILFDVRAPTLTEWALLIIAMVVGRWLAIYMTKKIVEMTPKDWQA
ncbi:MAG: cation-translocating P-type ATPase C-terminal domain-containing protein, partial [Candidatus Micrarchaeota archaeon]